MVFMLTLLCYIKENEIPIVFNWIKQNFKLY
jgi:hypothetical protein